MELEQILDIFTNWLETEEIKFEDKMESGEIEELYVKFCDDIDTSIPIDEFKQIISSMNVEIVEVEEEEKELPKKEKKKERKDSNGGTDDGNPIVKPSHIDAISKIINDADKKQLSFVEFGDLLEKLGDVDQKEIEEDLATMGIIVAEDKNLSDSKDEEVEEEKVIQVEMNDGCETCKLYDTDIKKGGIIIAEACTHEKNVDENGGFRSLPKHINALKQCGWYIGK